MHTNVSSTPKRPATTRPHAIVFRFVRMRRTLALLAGLGALSSSLSTDAAAQVEPREGDLVVLGGRLWDGTSDAARPNPGILIRNGTIMRVGEVDPMGTGAEALLLDASHFVMPGLFDLHAHYAVDLFGEGRVDEYTVNPVLFLANGVTSTFPAGEVDPAEARRGRERIASGEIPGPRIHASGPYWGTARPGWDHAAMTPDSIRREATYWALRGARGFKAKGIRPEQLRALIEVAHEHGITVTGHLDSGFRDSVNPRDAILMGIDRIEHFLGGDALPASRSAYASLEALDLGDPVTAGRIRAQARLFVEQGAYFDATLTAYGYFADREPAVFNDWANEMDFLTAYARDVVEARLPRTPNDQFERIYYVKRRTVKAFLDAGGANHLTLGTDHPSWGEFWSGFGAHRELHAMVLAGIPNAAALRAGTANAARALGVDARLGTIAPGKYADLLIVRGDPLTTITDTRNGHLVIRSGTVYRPDELFRSVRGKMGPVSEAEAEWWMGNARLGR
jgi:imidazolonepropionase-like amidohydrolase